MPNYKPKGITTVGHYHKHAIQSDETVVVLTVESPQTAQSKSMIDIGSTDYQVTSGKTFYAVELIFNNEAVASNLILYEGDTADATTLQKWTWQQSSLIGAPLQSVPLNFTVASGKFVVCTIGTASSYRTAIVIGYEK